ncbi:TetR/AcrR family transcriptional regulator, partial [Blautia producta]
MYSTQNPIAIQSQKWLVSALLVLMQKKAYKSITIKEIARKADLDRSTFYRNFKSKQDILNFHLDSLTQDYISKISELNELDMQKIFKVFLDFCNVNLDFII